VKFTNSTRGVDAHVLGKVIEVLQGAGVVGRDENIKGGDDVIGIETT
jgi:hypothetical protein